MSHQDDPTDIEPQKMELAADWRAHPPVLMDVGPVLHPDDAVGNKMAALYGRALARDFLDVDAIVQSGRYTREDLLLLAGNADAGFDRAMFAQALGAAELVSDDAFLAYGVEEHAIRKMRVMFAAWRQELLAG